MALVFRKNNFSFILFILLLSVILKKGHLEDPAIFSRRYLNKVKAQYVRGNKCNMTEISFHWDIILQNQTILVNDHYKYGDTFHMEPYSIGSGEHHFMIYVFEFHTTGFSSLSDACTFIIIPEDPIPIIKGGSEITMESLTPIVMDGRGSIDMEVPPNHKGRLEYLWNCTVSDVGLSNVCKKKFPREAVLKIPAKYAINNLIYTFNLYVRSKESDWIRTRQIINVKTEATILKITCSKNCPPHVLVTNVKDSIIFKVNCLKNCKHVKEDSYNWSISEENFDYDENTNSGQFTDVFYIKGNVLKMEKTYQIHVQLRDNLDGKTALEFTTHKSPKLELCAIFPETGKALITEFSVACEHPKGQYMFEVYSTKDNAEILLDRNGRLQGIVFILMAKSKVKIKMIDEFEYSDSMTVDVTVEDNINLAMPKDDLIEEIEATYFNEASQYSFGALMKEKNYDEMIQVFSIFSEELGAISKDKELEATVLGYKIKILDTLAEIPVESRDRVKQVSEVALEVAEHARIQYPDVTKKVTDICKKSAKMGMDMMNKERYKQSFADEIIEDAQLFSNCSQVTLTPNFDLLEFSETITLPSTPFPVLEFPVIDEDYPDYVNDENVSKVQAKLDSSANNLLEICLLNTEALADLTVPYELGIYIESDFYNVTATKKFGKDISNVEIVSHDTTLKASKDFLKYGTKEIEILYCTSKKNPFWWQNREIINTTTAIIQFKVGNKIIKKFRKPFFVSFEHPVNESLIISHNGTTPRKPNVINSQDLNFEKMAMYRIDVGTNQNYFIEFTDFPSNILKIYVTKYYKPTIKEFKAKSKTINESNNIVFVDNRKNYDLWHYLTILPADEMVEDEVLFKFYAYTLSCYRWKSSERAWIFSCAAANSSTKSKIDCLCYKSSVLSARLTNNNLREEHTLYVVHKLEIQACYVIFVTVLVVWILYCALLTCFSVVQREDKRQEVYFLSDIPSFFRYGYIIIIKTANKSKASTTSNVVLKIYGKSSESKEHVLNFPDPDKKMLQKNQEDWFFLATQYYLGDIEKIELWFDSVGYRPSWYCAEMEIIDLQMKKCWWFLINYRFEIKHLENYIYTARPIAEEELNKSDLMRKKISTGLYGPHMWNMCDPSQSLSQITRLNLILSIFLTNFTLILLIYGIPFLRPSDSLGQYIQYGIYHRVVWASIIGSILTFQIHYFIIHFFRNASIFLIILSMTVVLIFGFWVPHVTSLLWLTSSLGSIMIYIFLLENLVRIFKNLKTKGHNRMEQIFSKTGTIVKYIETQRGVFYDKFGELAMRPYFKKLYTPLDSERIKEIKHLEKMKEKLLDIFEDIVMITLYVVLLYVIILKDKNPMAEISNSEIRDLVAGLHSRTYSEYIHGRKNIENYLTNTLVHSMQYFQWYGKFVRRDPGMTIDNSNKFIGIARLRQHRSDNSSCHVVPVMTFVQNNCVSRFFDGPEYGNFSENWDDDSKSDRFARMDVVWKYRGVLDTGTVGYVGKFGTYSGGGYVATLGRTLKNSLINIKYLDAHNWIDKHSRCLFIEFLTYSANTNMFNSIKIIFEISTTGFIITKYKVRTAGLLSAKENDVAMWIIAACFILIVLLLAVRLIGKLMKAKKMVFKDVWHIIDIIIIILSVACTFLYVKRSHLVKEFLERIEMVRHNEFVNYFHLFHAEVILTTMAAILVFLATFRLWKLLKFLIVIRVVEKTLSTSSGPLLCLCICHVHLIAVFTITGFLLFGNESRDFADFSDSFMSLVLSSMGFFVFDIGNFKFALHYFYYSVYALINILITTLYVGLINIHYNQSQNFYSNFEEYNVLDFVKDQCDYYKEICRVKFKNVRLKGGEDANFEVRKFVYPKEDDHRFAKCLTVEKYKLAAMRNVALSVMRNIEDKTRNLIEIDEELLKETIAFLFKKPKHYEDKDFFFLSNLKKHKRRLICDKTFLKMEATLNKMFNIEELKKKKEKYKTVIDNNNKQFDRILNSLNVVAKGLNSAVLE